MKKDEYIKEVSWRTGLSTVHCKAVVDAFIDTVKEMLVDGEKIVLPGLMVIEPCMRAPHRGRDPVSGEVVVFPPMRAVRVKVSQQLKDAMREED